MWEVPDPAEPFPQCQADGTMQCDKFLKYGFSYITMMCIFTHIHIAAITVIANDIIIKFMRLRSLSINLISKHVCVIRI